MGEWKFNGANPLISYGIGVEFGSPLSPSALKAISVQGASLADDLPRKLEQQSRTFHMGIPSPQGELSGVIFDELERDGTVKKQLAALPASITYQVNKYRRWVEFWPTAERLLMAITEIAVQSSPISGVSLNAVNRFFWGKGMRPISVPSLVRRDCKYLVPDILSRDNLSHSNYGFIEYGSVGSRIDTIIFSTSTDQSSDYYADIIFNLRFIFNAAAPHVGPVSQANNNRNPYEKLFKDLHESNNDLFASVVTPEILLGIPGVSSS